MPPRSPRADRIEGYAGATPVMHRIHAIMASQKRSPDSGSLGKALDVLRCFIDRQEKWGVRELAEKLDMPSSTAHRLLRNLALEGYLRFDQDTRKYSVGLEMY